MRSNLDMIIWSKDRACQLDLLLRSTAEYCNQFNNITIVWKASDQPYQAGYEKIRKINYKLKNLNFIEQADFGQQIKDILNNSKVDYVLGNSDDNVFTHAVPELPKDIFGIFKVRQYEIAQFSLRLGFGLNYCLPAKKPMTLNNPEEYANDYIVWRWDQNDPATCYGYPANCDSGIYRRSDWFNKIRNASFNNPKTLEEHMNFNRDMTKPLMASFKQSYLISISNNQLGQGSNLPNGEVSLEELNLMWLTGKQIILNFPKQVTACHIIHPYIFERQGK